MDIVKPIIIVGTGRCGSTAFHRLLAKHPRVMWLSGLCVTHPDKPQWNRRYVSALGNPLVRKVLGNRIVPVEAYNFWDRLAFGFSQPYRDLRREDVTPRVKKQVREVMGSMLTSNRDRLLIKVTGWPRIGYLAEIFPDAKFIHILRDGRAVANSLLHIDFWKGWHGPQGWRAGLLSAEDQAAWNRSGQSFVALAGLEWKIQMRAMEAARRAVDPSQFREVRYEDYCINPVEEYRRVVEFAELPWSDQFEADVRSAPLESKNDRWRKDLTAAQQAVLNDVLRDDLRRLGYDAYEAHEAPERVVEPPVTASTDRPVMRTSTQVAV